MREERKHSIEYFLYRINFYNIHLLFLVGPGQRGLVSVGVSMMFALGFVFLSFIAYLIHDWRRLMIFVSLLYIPFLTMYRYHCKPIYIYILWHPNVCLSGFPTGFWHIAHASC